VGLDDLFDDEQAQPGAGNAEGGLAWEAMVLGEQSRQLGRTCSKWWWRFFAHWNFYEHLVV